MAPSTREMRIPGSASADCQWRLETLGLVAEGVVHDFNNILATISGFAELILSKEAAVAGLPDDVEAFARHILDAALSGQTTVRELRGFARQAGSETERLDLHDVLRQSLTMARGALGGRVRIQADLMPGGAILDGRRGLLHNVFINLFMNARDAMPRGGVIQVRTSMLGNAEQNGGPVLVVSVKDAGTGMTEEVRARIFDRYFTTKGIAGSGLGLSNVRETVEKHGGWITVESALERGTEFRLHFPLTA